MFLKGINYLITSGFFDKSPYYLLIGFGVIIYLNLDNLKHVLKQAKSAGIKIGVAYIVYLVVKFLILPFVYNQLNISISKDNFLTYTNFVLFGYFTYVMFVFMKKNLRTFKNWYYLYPIFSVLLSKIVTLLS